MGIIEFLISATLLYITGRIIYNLYFHPLAHFPGPLTWRALTFTNLWVMASGRLPFKIKELHDRYGPVVRIAPDTLSLTDPRAWRDVFHSKNILRPSPYGEKPPGVEADNLISADAQTHARFRKVMNPAFSDSAIRDYEPVVKRYFDKLLGRSEERLSASRDGTPDSAVVDLVHWINCAIYDIIGHLTWGKSFECVELDQPPALLAVLLHFKATVIVTCIAHYSKLLVDILTPKSVLIQLEQVFTTGRQRISERLASNAPPANPDIMSYMLRKSSGVHDMSLSLAEIEHNSLSIILAGSETVTSTISAAIAFLLANPVQLQRLTREIRLAFPSLDSISGRKAAELPFLQAVLNETMRMYPAIPDGLRRRVPRGGAQVCGEPLPAGVTVAVACYSMFHSERHFSQAEVFAPERWLRDQDGGTAATRFPVHNVEAFQPFSVGPHGCMGQGLAWMEMRVFLCMLLWRYDLDVPAGQDVASWTDQNIWWTWEKRPLHVRLAKVQ